MFKELSLKQIKPVFLKVGVRLQAIQNMRLYEYSENFVHADFALLKDISFVKILKVSYSITVLLTESIAMFVNFISFSNFVT